MRGLRIAVASLVVEHRFVVHGLSYPEAYGLLFGPGIELVYPVLADSYPLGHQESPPSLFFLCEIQCFLSPCGLYRG